MPTPILAHRLGHALPLDALPTTALAPAPARRALPWTQLGLSSTGPVTGLLGAGRKVGTTTLSVLTAARVASMDRVVCVDADFDRDDVEPGSAGALGLPELPRDAWKDGDSRLALDELVDGDPAFRARRVRAAMVRDGSGAWMMPLPDVWRVEPTTPPTALRDVVANASASAERIVVDLGHTIDALRAVALGAMDQVVVVTTPLTRAAEVDRAVCAIREAGVPAHAIWFVRNRARRDEDVDAVGADRVITTLPLDPGVAEQLWQTTTWPDAHLAPGTVGGGIDRIARWLTGRSAG